MTHAAFNKLCRDLEKTTRPMREQPTHMLTEEELDQRILTYLEKVYQLPKEEIARLLSLPKINKS